MTALRQAWQVYMRGVRVLVRQPAYLAMTLIQPIIWLLLFGALFKAVTHIPGFHGSSYINFLTPGVVVMLAVFSAGWTGMGFIEDINGGVMDRMLAAPVWRGALNAGTVAYGAVTVVDPDDRDRAARAGARRRLQGRRRRRAAADPGCGVAGGRVRVAVERRRACSRRQRETLIGAVTFVQLPLTFLSAALMQQSLVPGWIRTVAKFNPVNWAVEAARGAAMQKIDWGLVAGRIGLLAALTLVCAAFASGLRVSTSARSRGVNKTNLARGHERTRDPPTDGVSASGAPHIVRRHGC